MPVEDLVEQPVVTDAIAQKRVARALNGLDLLALRARIVFERGSAIRYGVDRSVRQLVVWPLRSSVRARARSRTKGSASADR